MKNETHQQSSLKHHAKERSSERAKYLGDVVYGSNDGIITTFAVISGAVGASFSPAVIIILGVANLISDGFSMGASNYLSLSSQKAYHKSLRKHEEWEIENMPETELNEVREILFKWGVPETMVEKAATSIASNKKRWVDLMMQEEFGVHQEQKNNALKHGIATFLAFIVAGSLPLLAFLVPIPENTQFPASMISTAIALFSVGALRTTVTRSGRWLFSGLQMLAVGGIAAGIAYTLGYFVQSILGVVL